MIYPINKLLNISLKISIHDNSWLIRGNSCLIRQEHEYS